MRLTERFWASVTYLVSCFTSSPYQGSGSLLQTPLLGAHHGQSTVLRGPIFKPPGGRPTGPGSDFVCDYSNMPGFKSCSTPEDRSCWLRNDKTGQVYDISTNYEDINQTPVGITRHYYLNITDGSINADGLPFPLAKMFNSTYPGPWIQACWGDNVKIIVKNEMKSNGTSVHWHGIRQWLTMHMDGVNGVTQCPIAPQDNFTYHWTAMQYGSSWYHSHYSVQYADGAAGPLTLHGPSSFPFDEPKTPILMTDWGHNSAFEAIWFNGPGLINETILLNGAGNATRFGGFPATLKIPSPYTIHFDRPSHGRPLRYLLRIINTSFDSTFVFSIDNHKLTVIESDFVPIVPYNTTSVLVGIGQRYHVVVEANPQPNEQGSPPSDGNFWIRTGKANCFRFDQNQALAGYNRTGILRYSDSKMDPISTPWQKVSLACSDEDYANLKPILRWTVGKPPANDPTGGDGEEFTVQAQFEPTIFPLALFSMGGDDFSLLWIDYNDPTFLHLDYSGKWAPLRVIFPENYTNTSWVSSVSEGFIYMVIKGRRGATFGAHPIHLHGHDFAILQQIEGATFPAGLNLTYDNPPRRDVVLLPNNGYVVIAFKTDNPGVWLVHCHIANHASFGLAMQILERQDDAIKIWPDLQTSPALQNAQRGCDAWNKWWGDCNNWWPGEGKSCGLGEDFFAPDSGI